MGSFSFIFLFLVAAVFAHNKKKECQFGVNPRSFDILKTSDCSCNNFEVQFKLTQIATDYVFNAGILSANRNGGDELRNSGKDKFINFAQTFIDDNAYYQTGGFAGSLTWNSLNEFLFDGNGGIPSFVDFVLGTSTTFIFTTSNWIITDCSKQNNQETVTLRSLFTFYNRPDDVLSTDVIGRGYASMQFNKIGHEPYLINSQIYQSTVFPIQNANRTDNLYSTFQF